jgi:histone-lysine N-methyltransferase SETMAR
MPEHAVQNREFTSAKKTMHVRFFSHKGVIPCEFIAQGQMVNQQCYLEVLTWLRKSLQRKITEFWLDKWILHHDSAPVLDVLIVHEFLVKKSITKMDHPPYSTDLVPCDFWLFPKLRNALKGQRFADIPDIQCNMIKVTTR